jgi:hypothetical protein
MFEHAACMSFGVPGPEEIEKGVQVFATAKGIIDAKSN